jgi:hypothetical protein
MISSNCQIKAYAAIYRIAPCFLMTKIAGDFLRFMNQFACPVFGFAALTGLKNATCIITQMHEVLFSGTAAPLSETSKLYWHLLSSPSGTLQLSYLT